MQNAIVESIKVIAQQYEVSQARIAEILADIITRAYNKQIPDQNITITIDVDSGTIKSVKNLTVIDDNVQDYDDLIEIPMSEAKQYGQYNIGDTCQVPFDIFSFFKKNEIATIMQVFKQKLIEINNVKVYDKWKPRLGELINCMVEKYDPTKQFYIIDLDDGNMGFMSKTESIPGENLIPGQRYQFYVKNVKEQSKGWPIILSRADANFVLKLLEIEVPEIAMGEIKVESIERIAGFKTKIIVSSEGTNYDPASIVVGQKGNRIKNISDQLNGEKVEVIKFIPDKKQLLINACGPNNLVGIQYVEPKSEDDQPYATLITTEKLLPVLIGRKGNNIKLISKLLNCGIDINTVEEAKTRNIQYETINSIESLNHNTFNSYGNKASGKNWSSNHPSSNAKGSSFKPEFNNDNLLEDINSLSKEELEAKYGLQLNIDINAQQNQNTIHDQNDDIDVADETLLNMEFENNDLADAFADEIANIEKEEK